MKLLYDQTYNALVTTLSDMIIYWYILLCLYLSHAGFCCCYIYAIHRSYRVVNWGGPSRWGYLDTSAIDTQWWQVFVALIADYWWSSSSSSSSPQCCLNVAGWGGKMLMLPCLWRCQNLTCWKRYVRNGRLAPASDARMSNHNSVVGSYFLIFPSHISHHPKRYWTDSLFVMLVKL